MKARGAVVQGSLAALGLVAAYVTWRRPPESHDPGSSVVVNSTKVSLERVRYDDGSRFLELERKTDGAEPIVWLRLSAAAPIVSPQAPDAGTPPAAPADPPKTLRGNERADKAYELFAPLRAVRVLGQLSAEKKKEVGLEGTSRRLEVTVNGAKRGFRVAGTVAGVSGTYIEDELDGTTYLLSRGALNELEPNSKQLIDLRLHAFKQADFDTLSLRADGSWREFVQTPGATPQTSKLAPKASPDKPDDLARNWHDRVWTRLLVSEPLGKDVSPKTGEPAVALRLEYSLNGKPKGHLELAPGQGTDIFARTEQTAGWVLLHGGAKELLDEAKKLIEAKP